MSTHRNIDKICVFITVLAIIFTVIFMNGKSLGIAAVVDEDAESYEGPVDFTQNDLDGDRDTSGACVITLEGDEIRISGNGAYANDGNVYISNAGTYVISGKLDDGQIVVDTYQSSKVWIMLDGVDVYCSDDAALRINQADKVFVTLAKGSVNELESGAEYSEDALEDGTGGTIFSHDDLTVNGSGSLTVTAAYKHGIDVNDSLVITGGTISVTAPEDGIHVNDDMKYCNADLTVDASDDAINVGNAFMIASGSIYAAGCYEGIEACTIEMRDGDITIYPTDDGLNATDGSADSGFGFGGGMQPPTGTGGFGGRMRYDNGGDNGNTAGDTFEGTESMGEWTRPEMPEGMEEGMRPEMPASSEEAESTEEDRETWIHISGGNLTIINESGRDADGLDSNGDIIITGGTIRISVVGSGSNNAIDYGSESGGVFEINGGTVIACGGSSMAERASSSSDMASIMYNPDGTVAAGTRLSLTDEDGNELLEWTVPCSYSSVILSSPEMEKGETYFIHTGDGSKGIEAEAK